MSIIKVENIGKKYLIRHEKASYVALRDKLAHPIEAFKHRLTYKPEDFWALRNISFEVAPGEVVGIIGPNGSGKSTLLKVLSRITPPTEGQAILHGRVASLLEVGTGFHPELTGRENIFLSGVILGMTKAEVSRKFDEIVAFSGVEKFLDTPVKYYSSGMGVRLGFAVAAHLDSDILIIDEVLAVGDAEFQQKCMAKMNELTQGTKKAILFVSHNLDAVEDLCSRTILLKKGGIVAQGESSQVIRDYVYGIKQEVIKSVIKAGDEEAKIINCRLINKAGEEKSLFSVHDQVGVEIEYEQHSNLKIVPNFSLSLLEGTEIFQSIGAANLSVSGHNKVICWLPNNFLNNRLYKLLIALVSFNPTKDHAIWEMTFSVEDDLTDPLRGDYKADMHGAIRPALKWEKTV